MLEVLTGATVLVVTLVQVTESWVSGTAVVSQLIEVVAVCVVKAVTVVTSSRARIWTCLLLPARRSSPLARTKVEPRTATATTGLKIILLIILQVLRNLYCW